jgi:5-(carboxyamino)imidazole ribonucleotide mutase
MTEVVIIAGSKTDEAHVAQIADALAQERRFPAGNWLKTVYASAHREPLLVLKTLEENPDAIIITVAGRSNALSGMVAANCNNVVIACPPFKDLSAYMVDIHSTLRMPSNVPVLTVIDPHNCALAVARILGRKPDES